MIAEMRNKISRDEKQTGMAEMMERSREQEGIEYVRFQGGAREDKIETIVSLAAQSVTNEKAMTT